VINQLNIYLPYPEYVGLSFSVGKNAWSCVFSVDKNEIYILYKYRKKNITLENLAF